MNTDIKLSFEDNKLKYSITIDGKESTGTTKELSEMTKQLIISTIKKLEEGVSSM